MDNSCKVPEVKPITIKRFGTAGLVPTVPTTLDCNLWQKTDLKDGEFALNTVDDKLYIRSGNEIIELTNQSATDWSTFNGKQNRFIQASATLTTAGWSLVSGLYEQVLSNANIAATSSVDIIPNNADIDVVFAAQILPKTDAQSGGVKVYGKNLPTANIGVTLQIWQ